MKIYANVNRPDLHKIVIEEDEFGAAVFIFRGSDSTYPEEDYLDDSIEQAKDRCLEDFNVSKDLWRSDPSSPEGSA